MTEAESGDGAVLALLAGAAAAATMLLARESGEAVDSVDVSSAPPPPQAASSAVTTQVIDPVVTKDGFMKVMAEPSCRWPRQGHRLVDVQADRRDRCGERNCARK
ncbi:MAG TPA: hypothetical protein VEZ89_07700 [Rubrivivax sp.]|nr:hypothetical protein [Rubrivivax sp.]